MPLIVADLQNNTNRPTNRMVKRLGKAFAAAHQTDASFTDVIVKAGGRIVKSDVVDVVSRKIANDGIHFYEPNSATVTGKHHSVIVKAKGCGLRSKTVVGIFESADGSTHTITTISAYRPRRFNI